MGDINISELVKFHYEHRKAVTMTSTQPEGRFGSLIVDESQKVIKFNEKPKGEGGWINAGFFVCEPNVFDYIIDTQNNNLEWTKN